MDAIPRLWVSNRGEKHPCWHTILLAKSSVLYLWRPLTLERGCHPTGQAVSRGSRTGGFCGYTDNKSEGFAMSKIRLFGCSWHWEFSAKRKFPVPTGEPMVYKIPPQRNALKPPRQLQPEVVHRRFFQLLCSALTQIEMDCRTDHRMLCIVCEAVTIQEVGLLPLFNSVQCLIKLTQGFLLYINLFRRLGDGVGYRFDAQHPFFAGENFVQTDFLKSKSVCGVGHSHFILRERIPYQVGHSVSDGWGGIG